MVMCMCRGKARLFSYPWTPSESTTLESYPVSGAIEMQFSGFIYWYCWVLPPSPCRVSMGWGLCMRLSEWCMHYFPPCKTQNSCLGHSVLSFCQAPREAVLPRSDLKPGYWRCTQDLLDDLIIEDAVLVVLLLKLWDNIHGPWFTRIKGTNWIT